MITASNVASFVLAPAVSSAGICGGCGYCGVAGGRDDKGGILKAWVRRMVSVRCEKVASRERVRICEKEGDSMRSAVVERRCRNRGEIASIVVVAGLDACGEAGGEGSEVG